MTLQTVNLTLTCHLINFVRPDTACVVGWVLYISSLFPRTLEVTLFWSLLADFYHFISKRTKGTLWFGAIVQSTPAITVGPKQSLLRAPQTFEFQVEDRAWLGGGGEGRGVVGNNS